MEDDFNNVIHESVGPMAPIPSEHNFVMYLRADSKLTIWESENNDPYRRLLYVRNDIEEWLIDNFDIAGINWTIDRVSIPNSCNLYMNKDVASAFKLRWL